MKRILEIRPGEGGDDSKLLVADLAKSYRRLCERLGWECEVTEYNDRVEIAITGDDLSKLANESGGHRFQRVPPTERRGRVHTSTVTVAVMSDACDLGPWDARSDDDFVIEWYSGSGKGGQHRNKHQNSCRLTHKPTGVMVTSQTRSRKSSYDEAMTEMVTRLDRMSAANTKDLMASSRREQVGSGMRGDKIRTIRFQDDSVSDHKTGRTMKATAYMKGMMDVLWPK